MVKVGAHDTQKVVPVLGPIKDTAFAFLSRYSPPYPVEGIQDMGVQREL